MKKLFLILAALLLPAPFLTFADSYDGPYCFEAPHGYSYYNDDPNHIRGTCKSIEMTSIVSLDSSLKNDYLLAQHTPIDFECYKISCATLRYSEIIQPTLTALTFGDEDVAREYQDYDYSSGKAESLGLIHPDTAILLDKKYVLDYLSSIYGRSGIKLEDDKFPKIVLMDRNEMKKVKSFADDPFAVGYNYDILLALFKGKNDPLYVAVGGEGPFNSTSTPAIYTFNYSDFGKHIHSLKGSLKESHYLDLDKTKLPPVNTEFKNAGYSGIKNTVPITSPVKSVKNYWIFTRKDGKIVLAWQKSEYGLDNGKVDVVSNDDIKMDNPTSGNPTTVTSSSTTNVPVILPTEQKRGFFSKILELVLSWFK